jgi:hypothetical protein
LFPEFRLTLEESQYSSATVMNRVPVESSVLASVLYLPSLRRLEIEFRSGPSYQYSDVPESTYNELLTAESKGAYFNANIRNRFSSQQIDRPLHARRAPV